MRRARSRAGANTSRADRRVKQILAGDHVGSVARDELDRRLPDRPVGGVERAEQRADLVETASSRAEELGRHGRAKSCDRGGPVVDAAIVRGVPRFAKQGLQRGLRRCDREAGKRAAGERLVAQVHQARRGPTQLAPAYRVGQPGQQQGVTDRLLFGGERRPELPADRDEQFDVDHRDRVSSGEHAEQLGGNARGLRQGDGARVLRAQAIGVHRQRAPGDDHPKRVAVGNLARQSMQHIQAAAAVDLGSAMIWCVTTAGRHVPRRPRGAIEGAQCVIAREPESVADHWLLQAEGHRPAGTGSAGGGGAGGTTAGGVVVSGAGAVAGTAGPGSVSKVS